VESSSQRRDCRCALPSDFMMPVWSAPCDARTEPRPAGRQTGSDKFASGMLLFAVAVCCLLLIYSGFWYETVSADAL
jgi:hypothetical protein